MQTNQPTQVVEQEYKEDILDLFDTKVPYSHAVRVLEKYVQQAILAERSRVVGIVEQLTYTDEFGTKVLKSENLLSAITQSPQESIDL